ncbi:MAG: T9SS type A sorting domain-containing protein [Ignavibacteria bacterium]
MKSFLCCFSNRISVLFFLILTSFSFSQQYIKVNGTHFSLNGKPYYFTGTNFWYGCYIGSTGQTGDRERLTRELDRLNEAGIKNLRILGASENSASQNAIKPAIQISPGVYDDSLLTGLDFLLSEMGARNMHAVIFLNNYWDWSGGMGIYNAWFGGNSWDASGFYRNINAKEAFKNYIEILINRINTITGLYYYEDPAIMAWELANEPRPGFFAAYVDSFYNWIDETAEFIHSLDTNHLVATGNEGTKGSFESENIYLTAHSSEYIDYATIHLCAKNWGWFDANNIEGTYPTALANAESYIQAHIALARQLNKPLTMEEFGLPRDNEENDPASPTTARDNYFTALLQLVYDSAASGSPIAGSNFWGWGGEGRSPNQDHMWRTGDPFVCDPPMEAQGLNSIYDSDSSTIEIIKQYSAMMESLNGNTGVNTRKIISDFQLYQNYPNPFNPITNFEFRIPALPAGRSDFGLVTLKVFDVLGREVATLVNEEKPAGTYTVKFDGGSFASGVYLYRLQAGNYNAAKKLLLLK